MNSLVKVFSNFKEFYSEINGATLTGAIDVIVVEQPDGEFQCSPFHVRFGKLGVLRSREKVVDIEINGEPVDIHMKLGESGEAFFVEECPEEDVEELPENLATSPLPTNCFPKKFSDHNDDDEPLEEQEVKTASDLPLPLPLPRRNSIDFSKELTKDEDTIVPKFENQVSDYSHRRHTDNTLERRNLGDKMKEYTTQKIRQEWAEHEEIFQFDVKDKDWSNSTQTEDRAEQVAEKNGNEKATHRKPSNVSAPNIEVATAATEDTKESTASNVALNTTKINATANSLSSASIKEESKGKKKRRKKSQMKKKNAQRKSSSSSSVGSNTPQDPEAATPLLASQNELHPDTLKDSNNANANTSSNDDESPVKSSEQASAALLTAKTGDESLSASSQTSPKAPTAISAIAARIPDLDIHFFSDTEVTSSGGGAGGCSTVRGAGRPSTPIQSDSEIEISMREKDADLELMSNSASWKWGELPTHEHNDVKDGYDAQVANAQAQRNSMLSNMFNFMKKTNKIRQQVNDGGIYLSDLDPASMDPEMAAMYFPLSKESSPANGMLNPNLDDDRESGNGTSLPHSPSSLEGQKSIDSDYEDGGNKQQDGKYLDFVAMSLCGVNEKAEPTDEEFDAHLIKYSDVCENPSLFSSPNLVVRLNGKYYSWAAACPIVMTIITFQKPLTNDAIEQISMAANKDAAAASKSQLELNNSNNAADAIAAGQQKRSWWYWRRTQSGSQPQAVPTNNATPKNSNDERDGDQTAVATTQTTRPNSPDVSEATFSKTDSTLNAENTSAIIENFEDLSQASSRNEAAILGLQKQQSKLERYKKSLRLSSEAIKKLNLKDGMNEIEFSVTTAYQGTSRCKCYLFRWKHNDKVVISDIDGTITKSDVLGHLLPMVGKDWAQLGVAQLFSKIEQNGYKLLYLSARAIGQSRATREYLRSIRQGDVKLPDGPLLLNPTSLISAFHREVIERKPEQFKIACLSDIRDLFPDRDPFYAGYGNRINDVWAYRAVGIPIMRIFTINTKGELKHELTQTFQSSGYINQSLEVHEYFPPLENVDDYEYKTDVFDDEMIEAELQFSETETENDDDESYSDEYADDGIGDVDVEIDMEIEQEIGVINDVMLLKHRSSIAGEQLQAKENAIVAQEPTAPINIDASKARDGWIKN